MPTPLYPGNSVAKRWAVTHARVMLRDPNTGPFWVTGEDLMCGCVGPFETREAVEKHLEFQRQRGDAAVVVHNNAKVVSDFELENEYRENSCTPAEDKVADD